MNFKTKSAHWYWRYNEVARRWYLTHITPSNTTPPVAIAANSFLSVESEEAARRMAAVAEELITWVVTAGSVE